jgi:F-type H+-transporting ATPase subunit delta
MGQTNQTTGAAANYARSLLELAGEKQQAEPVGQELSEIRQIVVENPTFGSFLADPAIGEIERGETLRRIFEGRVSPLVMNFMQVLNSKGRLGNLVSIADAYDELLDELLGKVEVDVTVAQRLGSDQLEDVRRKVSAALKKDAVLHQYVDESIIGGMILRVQDQLIDGSVKAQLTAMKQKLLDARPR